MCVSSISCPRAILTGFVVWHIEELEVVQAIVGVQPAFPDGFTAALLHDRALATAEHDEVAASSKLLHGDQVEPGTEVWDTPRVGDTEVVAGHGADAGAGEDSPVVRMVSSGGAACWNSRRCSGRRFPKPSICALRSAKSPKQFCSAIGVGDRCTWCSTCSAISITVINASGHEEILRIEILDLSAPLTLGTWRLDFW